MTIQFSEKEAAIAAVLVGLGVAFVMAPWNEYFFPNFAFYWGSQAAVLLAALLFKPRLIAISGIAAALATYLAIFGSWLLSRERPDSMAWLGYLFSLPGALIAAITSAISLKRNSTRTVAAGWIFAFGLVACGIALNQTAICLTFMYCTGK